VAQGLHNKRGIRAALLWLLLPVALWQVPGCLIPPDVVEDPDNRPPELDWKLSTPEGYEVKFFRDFEISVEFSIAISVTDPEADPLNYVWYYDVPGSDVEDDLGPMPLVGKETMTLIPCEIYSLRNVNRVDVAVWVSDEPLEFDKDAELFPIIYGVRPPAVRFWTVELKNECK